MWKDSADVEKHVQFLESIYGAGSSVGVAPRAEPALKIVSKFDRERGVDAGNDNNTKKTE